MPPLRRSLRLAALVLLVPVSALLLAFTLTRSPASLFFAALLVVASIVFVTASYIAQVLAHRQSVERER